MDMRARDTSERAAAIQERLQRAMSPEQKLRMVLESSDFARLFARGRLRREHPEYTEAELSLALTEQLYGRRPHKP